MWIPTGEMVRGGSDRGTEEREVWPDWGPGALEGEMNGTVERGGCADGWSGDEWYGMMRGTGGIVT